LKRPIRLVVLGVAVSALAIAQPYRLVQINGRSMTPSFESGAFLVSSRIVPTLHHGDVVVFKHEDETLVKRVAFMPGDRILQFWFRGSWFIAPNDFLVSVAKRHKYPSRWISIPEGRLFVLGDNTYESLDSRSFGPISRSDVIGRVLVNAEPEMVCGFAGSLVRDERTTAMVPVSLPLPPNVLKTTRQFLVRR